MKVVKKITKHWENFSLENIIEEIDGVIYTEEWRGISNYEGIYQISSFGRVKSLSRTIFKRHKSGKIVGMPYKEFIMAVNRLNNGYIQIGLSNNKSYKHYCVHRLVAQAFIENPENKPQVNHMYGNPSDNRAKKLEWVTRSENHKHAFRVLGRKPSKTFGLPSPHRRMVFRINNKTSKKTQYKSLTEAATKNNVCVSYVANRLKLHFKKPTKYSWQYA